MEIHGVGMDAAAVGPLRLWRHDEDDIDHGEIYILRGMKVVYGSKYSYEQNKWVHDTSVPMQLECNARTAIARDPCRGDRVVLPGSVSAPHEQCAASRVAAS